MSTAERVYLHLSSGLDYIEYHYLDENDNPIEKDLSSKVLILECDKDGNVLRERYGHVTIKPLDAVLHKIKDKLNGKKIKVKKEKKKTWSILTDIFKKK